MFDKKRMLSLLEASAPSGQEQAVTDYLKMLFEGYETRTDALGSLLVRLKKEGIRRLLLEAHIDQVGFVVTEVLADGFVRTAPVGGIDARLLPNCRLRFLPGGETGVVAAVPPHLKKGGEEKVVPVADSLIDVGPEAAEKIKVGDRAVFDTEPVFLAENYLAASALDNKAGVAVLLETADRLKNYRGDYAIDLLFAVREEVGNAGGAVTGAFQSAPDVCAAVDVSFAAQPGVEPPKCGVLGGGPMVGFAPVLDRGLSTALVKLAAEKNIPVQREIMSGDTSTDADGMQLTGGGIVSCLLSVPIRNMHGPYETVLTDDIVSTAALLAAAVEEGVL